MSVGRQHAKGRRGFCAIPCRHPMEDIVLRDQLGAFPGVIRENCDVAARDSLFND